MSRAQSGRAFLDPFRFGALLMALALIFLGSVNFFRSSLASTLDEEEVDYPRLFDDVERYLRNHYLDQERIPPRSRKLMEKALSTLEGMVDEVYVENSDPENPHVVVHVGGKSKALSLARINTLEDAIAALKDLSEFFKANYRGKQSLNDIRHFAINGFLSGLDPHTQVFNPKGFRDFSVHIEGEIFGVGMYVGSSKGTLIVRKVLKSTPAEKAGFKRGDRIVKIGEESTVNMDVTEAVNKIRGKEHSKVVLTVKRKDPQNKDQLLTLPIEVRRERVTIPSVVHKLLPAGAGALGFVQVSNFDKNTVSSLKESLETLRQENGGKELAGLILDLRDNSGGLLQQASEMSDLFLPEGELYWIAQKGREEVKKARNDRREPRYPMVVLANDLSASGAEIVIGALQKNHRAVVLGTPTFGKGSVQQLHPLNEEWQIKITVSEYLIPGKVSIQENGVVPDILAERVVLTDKVTNLFPNRRLGTERDYDDHLVSRFAKREEPKARIQYLMDVADPEAEDPEDPEPVGPGEIEPEKDVLARIAVRLLEAALAAAPSPDGFRSDAFLRDNGPALEKVGSERYTEIVDKLREKGIDWQEGPNPESPTVELSLEHQVIHKPSTDKDDPVPRPFLKVTARAVNRSEKPLHRIKALTRSDYYFYHEQELLFGKMDPGAVVERTVEMAIPYYPYARSDNIRFVVSGPGNGGNQGESILERDHEVILSGEERPSFAYEAKLVDKAKGEPITHLAPGTEAVLKLKVLNVGKAPAQKGVAVLRNQTGPAIFLEPPGRIEFTALEAGKEVEMEFSFRVAPKSDLKAFEFELGMVDSYSGEALSREIEIPAAGEEGKGFPNGLRYQAPQVEATLVAREGEAPGRPITTTDRSELELEARVEGGRVPFQAWITTSLQGHRESDPDKVHFSASEGVDGLKFRARVPLRKGTNFIQVVASDENGLQSRKVLVVRRKDGAQISGVAEKPKEG